MREWLLVESKVATRAARRPAPSAISSVLEPSSGFWRDGHHQRGQPRGHSRGRDRDRPTSRGRIDDAEPRQHDLDVAPSVKDTQSQFGGGRKKKPVVERFGQGAHAPAPAGSGWDMRAPSPLMPHVGGSNNAHDGNQYQDHGPRHHLGNAGGERVDVTSQVHPGGMGWRFDKSVHGSK